MEGFEFASHLMSQLTKSVLACVFATLGGTLFVAGLTILWRLPWLYSHPSQNPFGVFNTSAYGILIVIAFSSLVLFGLPLQAILQKFKLNGWVITVIAGALAGLILGYLIDCGFYQTEEQHGVGPGTWELGSIQWVLYAVGAVLGALYSGLAWLIRRPDKDPIPGLAPASMPPERT